MADLSPTMLALALHKDLTTAKEYADNSPEVVLAVLHEAEKTVQAIAAYIGEARKTALDKAQLVQV